MLPIMLSLGWITLLMVVIAILGFINLSKKCYVYRLLNKRQIVFLELIPPASVSVTIDSTEYLYRILHNYLGKTSLAKRFLGAYRQLSLEIVSTRSDGIRYILGTNKEDMSSVKKQLSSHLPGLKIRLAKDYLSQDMLETKPTYLMEFKQAKHFSHPLLTHPQIFDHDPVSYITGAMSKLLPNELIAFQIVISPFALSRSLHLHKSKDLKLTQEKLSQSLFRASVRALAIVDDPLRANVAVQSLASALGGFSTPDRQALVLRSKFPAILKSKYWAHAFINRLPGLSKINTNIFSASEIAGLYHFPGSNEAISENLIINHSRELPTPSLIKKRADDSEFDVVLGLNSHNESTTPLGLTVAERERHVFILGGTGNGKTTMMKYAVIQDIANGKGLAVVDPHGDFAKSILEHIPLERINDVVYVNPVDISNPIGINLLELPKGLSEDELLIEKDRVCEAAISVLRKIFSDDEANAHRIESLFRNAIRTAFEVEGATLFTVLKLLRNRAYRFTIVDKLIDQDLKDFWREEFGKAGEMQRVSMSKGLTARIDRFNSSMPAKRMLGQAESTINFEYLIDSSKILICNLAEGELIEDTSSLIGTVILAKIKLAAERRTIYTENDRVPFYLYVDEFQNFATTPFVKMLSSSRKYKLFLTIAQQSTNQQDDQRLTEVILANVRTVICFASGSPADERLILPQFEPYVHKGEIANLEPYNFYIRIRAEHAMEPMSGQTLLFDDKTPGDILAAQVINLSRENYSKKYEEPLAKFEKPTRPQGYIEVRPLR